MKTIGKVRSGTVTPRSSPRSVQAALSHGVQPTPKAAPAHLVHERLAQARLAAEAAETATFGSGASPERLIRDATMEEQVNFVSQLPAMDHTPVVVVGVATPTPLAPVAVMGIATPTPDEVMPTANGSPTAALDEPGFTSVETSVLSSMAQQMEHMRTRILEPLMRRSA